MLLNKPEVHADFLETYSSSDSKREKMLLDLLTTPLDEIDEFSKPDHVIPSNSTQTVRAYFRGIGINVRNVAVEDNEETEK
jgi:hypothetical protein